MVAAFDAEKFQRITVAVLIYCDFGVLSPGNREALLKKAHAALKPGGRFFVDAFSAANYADFRETVETSAEASGFWSPEPYTCIKRTKRYDNNNYLEQYTIINKTETNRYNIWNHAFTPAELAKDVAAAGFKVDGFFGDVAGAALDDKGKTICCVCVKE